MPLHYRGMADKSIYLADSKGRTLNLDQIEDLAIYNMEGSVKRHCADEAANSSPQDLLQWATDADGNFDDEQVKAYGFDFSDQPDTYKSLYDLAEQNDDLDFDGLVHDLKNSEASDINNGGTQKQIEYMISVYGFTETRRKIIDGDI